MARIRTIKPSFFTSLTIADLSIPARLTFAGLWTHCDDEGRCLNDARLLKAALWPLDDAMAAASIGEHVDEMVALGLIEVYERGGRSYIQVNGWSEHQRINRPAASGIPAPQEDSLNDHGGFTEDSLPEGKGRERKGKEQGSARSARARDRFDELWSVYPLQRDEAVARKAWTKALKATDAQTIISAALAHRDDPNRHDAYTKSPANWLNAESWRNGPEPPRDSEGPPPFRPTVVPTKCPEHAHMTTPCASCAAERAAGIRKDTA